MYILPNTTVRLLHNVPLEPTYDHTIYFDSQANQTNYFITKQKRAFTKNTYQRHTRDTMKVGVLADEIYDCNYLMFQNTAYGNKWFYAFITSIEYVNNVTSIVTYQIDVLQTWLFDFTLGQCLVERQHSESDNLYENLVPENLELGDYTVSKTSYINLKSSVADPDTGDFPEYNVGMLTTKWIDADGNVQPTKGESFVNIFSGLKFIGGVPSTDPESIKFIIEKFVSIGQEDAIVAIFQYPAFLGSDPKNIPFIRNAQTKDLNFVDGYAPKNKKLFSYPYCKLVVSNNSGERAEYKWEQFKYSENAPGVAYFGLTGTILTTPTVLLYPIDYMNISKNYDLGLVISSFPTVAWAGDAWKAWWAQNKGSVTSSMLSSAMTSIANIGVGVAAPTRVGPISVSAAQNMRQMRDFNTQVAQPVQAGTNLLDQAISLVGKKQDLERTPPQVHGQVQCDSLNAQIEKNMYTVEHQNIRAPFAKIIDDYWTMFGYPQNRLMVPNLHARPHWTYVKTVACVLTGSIPSDDAEFIVNIFNNGITWWVNGDEVGDYSLDNRPT